MIQVIRQRRRERGGGYGAADDRGDCDRLRVSVLTVRWLRQEGRFTPAIKVGRRLMWDIRDVDAWLEAQRETPRVA